jgi:hypothetical protein
VSTISAKSGDSLKKRAATGSHGGSASKSMKSTAKKFPTGLVADWKKKMSKTSDDTDPSHQRASSP